LFFPPVGAGIAGLYAARKLKQSGLHDILVVEAHTTPGGRVKEARGLVPWALPIGAEFVHGSDHNVVVDDLKKLGVNFTERDWPDWFYDTTTTTTGGRKVLIPPDAVAKDTELNEILELFDNIEDEQPPDPDITAAEWLKRKRITPRQRLIADAVFANDFGCSLDQLGVQEMIVENINWVHGPAYLTVNGSFSTVVQKLSEGTNIRFGWPVQRVATSSSSSSSSLLPGGRSRPRVTLYGPHSERMECDRVIMTPSVSVLQSGSIAFTPPLPESKREAIQRIKIGHAVKLIMAFSEPFWPTGMYDVVCPGSFIPEIWMLTYPTEETNVNGATCCVVCFMAGDKARQVSAMDPQEAADRCLAQLDEMFSRGHVHGDDGRGGGGGGGGGDPRPASSRLVDWKLFDWGKDPYAQGAYTFPCFGARPGDRKALAAPWGDAVFFAGEATHESVNPCIQAAAETGIRAAQEVQQSLAAAGRGGGGRIRSRL